MLLNPAFELRLFLMRKLAKAVKNILGLNNVPKIILLKRLGTVILLKIWV